MASRRAFLAGLACASLPRVCWAEVGSPAFLAAGKSGADYVLHGLTAQGESLFDIALPARGHAAAAHPTQALAVAFARRPGTYALVIDCLSGQIRHRLTPPEGRQFNGHGAFSADGTLLMTSEVVAEGSAGRIGLWDTASFRRIAEWDSGGIGPHDIKRLDDGSLVVANGGIRTDPGDRAKLNLSEMRPNLVRLSAGGEVLELVELDAELRQNSIRHLAVVGQSLGFAMQWEGDPAEPVPQLGLWRRGERPQLCPARPGEEFALQGYGGSIAYDPASGVIGVTSAPAGALMLFDAKGAALATTYRADISGLAAGPAGLVATDGQGAVWAAGPGALRPLAQSTTLWDNHLIALT